MSNTLNLAKEILKIKSVTPNDNGCQDILAKLLKKANFSIEFIEKDGTKNLLASHGSGEPHLLFLGHTDVVPEGDLDKWDYPPYECKEVMLDNEIYLYARGSADMKGADAAMTSALYDFVINNKDHKGTLSILITSNEEGDGVGGVSYVASLLKDRLYIPNYCVVGEPSSELICGDTIKIGRRGSLTAHITVHGTQGHVAYPHKIDNAIHKASSLIDSLYRTPIDNGNDIFPATSFQVTNIKAGVGAENVAPGSCYFMCNFRFNNLQTKESIAKFIEDKVNALNLKCDIEYKLNGMPFSSSKDSILVKEMAKAIYDVTKIEAKLSTSGGTSDGRFIAPLNVDVIEFGTLNESIHKVNEKILVKDLDTMHNIYLNLIERLFK